MKKQMLTGYLCAICSAVIYGCMPLMSKYIYADGVNPLTLVFLRNALSILPLGILAYREKKTLAIPKKILPSISLISLLGCSATPILLFSSYQFMASGTATVFHFVYPALVIVLQILFTGKKVQMSNLVSVALCVVGIGLFYAPGEPLNLTGSALALSSGLTFAIYVVLLSNFDRSHVSGFLFSFYVATISSIFLLITCLVTGNLALPTSLTGWGLCVLFSLAVTTGAVVLFQNSTFLIGGERTSILSTLEPITSIILGVIVFGEPFGLRVLIGTVLVVAASVLTAVCDMKKKNR